METPARPGLQTAFTTARIHPKAQHPTRGVLLDTASETVEAVGPLRGPHLRNLQFLRL